MSTITCFDTVSGNEERISIKLHNGNRTLFIFCTISLSHFQSRINQRGTFDNLFLRRRQREIDLPLFFASFLFPKPFLPIVQVLKPQPVAIRCQDTLPLYVKRMLRDRSKDAKSSSFQRLNNIILLIRNTRVHKELLARYNPIYGKSEQERIRATANRVGLEVPDLYEDAEKQVEEGIDEKYRS